MNPMPKNRFNVSIIVVTSTSLTMNKPLSCDEVKFYTDT